MRTARWSWPLCALLLLAASRPLLADRAPAAGEIRIADRPDEQYLSIQAAIDAAANGATVLIGEGRYDERLDIDKPIKLVGAGPDKTVLGPTAEGRAADVEAFRVHAKTAENRFEDWSFLGKTPADPKKVLVLEEMIALSAAIVHVENARGVELRSLGVTSPGDPRPDGQWDNAFHGVEVKNAGLRMTDCAVVGCVGDGVRVTGRSNVEIDDCLIAGSWCNGVGALRHGPIGLK
ncbi:MAG TPA: right-handed parallel beta-helix repeat-containing protein, partial [Pirellulales bacterium]